MTEQFERGMAFGPYVLEARLGGGGFGIVWRAREEGTGRLVALKILAGKFSAGETGRLRADVELLAAAASAESTNVVRVLGGGPDPAPHVVMEFIDGANLEDELERQERLSQSETLRILRGIAEALAVLHGAGIIHRDVKPANVMLARDGTVKLTDFGIAKIAGYESVTATGQLPLSAAYAAPEVWGGEATYQSDFYALGALAFQCLTGVRPFSGNFVQLFDMHRSRDPEYALLPGETVPALRQLIVRCLAKDPVARPESAEALLAMVSEAERQMESSNAVPTGLPTHEPRALGPWLIEAPHSAQPWAFACLHETTGERATVEVHFSDSLELGESLRRAVAANPQLVPLGAERLLGTNRLILRPGEAWPNQPPGRFMFWVAREELPSPLAVRPQDEGASTVLARSALALTEGAAAAGLFFRLHAGNTSPSSRGSVHAARVGLPDPYGGTVVEWLRTVLPSDSPLLETQDDTALRTRLAEGLEPAELGVAADDTGAGTITVEGESELIDRVRLAAPPDVAAPSVRTVHEPESEPQSQSEPLRTTVTRPPEPTSGRRRVSLVWLGGVGALATAALSAFLVFAGADEPSTACDEDTADCAVATPEGSPGTTVIRSATSTRPPTGASQISVTTSPTQRSATVATTPTTTSQTAPAGLPTTTSPTSPATLPPTKPPTLPPMLPPTKPPTTPPTVPPTTPPTVPPTQPPTVPPTAPPIVVTAVNLGLAAIWSSPTSGPAISAGTRFSIKASGIWCLGSGNCFGPGGEAGFNFSDNNTILPSEPKGTLIGRIGNGPWFRVGPAYEGIAPASGVLYFIFNDKLDAFGDNTGSLQVVVEIEQ